MQFDQFSIALLILRPDAPQLDDAAEAALQDAHMTHLADLHEAGYLLAAGPLLGDGTFRGLSILNVGSEQARVLKEADPAVRAGRYSVKVLPWAVPGGAITFSPAHFPRSVAEARGTARPEDSR
ncbi:MAG: YciI family protein [Dehalococcoidia bacterium]